MVRVRRRRQDHQDLGSGVRSAATHADGPHLYGSRSCGLTAAPLPLLLRRGQDGQMLGPGDQQSHPPLPRPSLRRLHTIPASDARRPRNRRPRRRRARLGHAHTLQHPRAQRAQRHHLRRQMSRGRSASHLIEPGQHRAAVGPRRREIHGRADTPQERRARAGRPSQGIHVCIRLRGLHQAVEMPRGCLHAELRRPQRHHQHPRRQ